MQQAHQRIDDPALGELIAQLRDREVDDDQRAGLRDIERTWRREVAVPTEIVERLGRLRGEGFAATREAVPACATTSSAGCSQASRAWWTCPRRTGAISGSRCPTIARACCRTSTGRWPRSATSRATRWAPGLVRRVAGERDLDADLVSHLWARHGALHGLER